MNIGIDIRVLARGRRTGVEEYVINLLPYLFSLDKNIHYKLFYNAYQKLPVDYPWLNWPNVELKEFKIPNRFLSFFNKYFDWPKIDKLLAGVDVFWAPHFLLSSTVCPRVVTFHDLSFEYFPECFPFRQRLWHASVAPRRQAEKAHKIIAVSESTKEDLIDLYRIPAEKISVIYPGVEQSFKPLAEISQPQRRYLRERYHLPDKFILYLGTLEPRKNLAGLIEAFNLFKKETSSDAFDFKLVLAGSLGWLYREIFRVARQSPFRQDIIFTGFIEPADKVYLYNLADLFVYPSFFEGFGFPPLEAMACGLPVITSNISSLPEVAGEAALTIDPYNPAELAWAMAEMLRGDSLRQEFRERGLARARQFSWQRCAEQTLALLKTTLS